MTTKIRTKNPKNYTLTNKGEISVLITVNKGKSYYYPYEDIKEYLNDLFIEYKENDIEYSIEYSENLNLKFKISSKVKSDSRYWTCFDLNNCLDDIKHLISYLYSLDYKLSRSNFYILNRHRMEPYGYIMDPFQKDLQSVYYFLDHNIDYNLNVMILNFENTQIE
jgi:hypothetical protein